MRRVRADGDNASTMFTASAVRPCSVAIQARVRSVLNPSGRPAASRSAWSTSPSASRTAISVVSSLAAKVGPVPAVPRRDRMDASETERRIELAASAELASPPDGRQHE